MTFDEFAECVAPLVQICPGNFDGKTAGVYFEVLKDLPVDALKAAVARLLYESENAWMPKPATLRRLALEWQESPLLSAEEAFGRVMEAARKFGVYRPDDALALFDEPTRLAIHAVGGWNVFTDAVPRIRGVINGQFVAAYNGIVVRFRAQQVPEAIRPRLPEQPKLIPHQVCKFLEETPAAKQIGLMKSPPTAAIQRRVMGIVDAKTVPLSAEETARRRDEQIAALEQRLSRVNGHEHSGVDATFQDVHESAMGYLAAPNSGCPP